MGFHDGADVGRQLRVLLFAPPPALRREAFLRQRIPWRDSCSPFLTVPRPQPKAPFRLASTATAQFRGHLGLE